MHSQQVNDLATATNNFANSAGTSLSKEVETNAELLVLWLEYLSKYQLTGTADSLLTALGASIRETAACLSLGLIRPALFSLRAQIDLALAWLYFKDHPIEWEQVNNTGDGFKMKKEILEFITEHNNHFKKRFSLLKGIAARKTQEPYRLLSAHIHGQSDLVLPVVNKLCDLVSSPTDCKECAMVAFEVAEYLNDVFLSIYASNWHSLPNRIHVVVNNRFVSQEQKGAFFE